MAGDSKTIKVKVKRQDGPGARPYYQRFEVPYQPGMNVISVLQEIAANPVTAEGEHVAPVVWECCCLEEVCGACTMLINGRVRQACSALIDDPTVGTDITLEPMSKFPVVRDLMVDRSRMFESLKAVRAWIPISGSFDAGRGPILSPQEQQIAYELSRCMSCGCCLEACPQYGPHSDFIGPAVISQVVRFNTHPTGKLTADERLEAIMGPGGITDCGNAQNCIQVCPKNIPLTDSIARASRATTLYAIRRFFTK